MRCFRLQQVLINLSGTPLILPTYYSDFYFFTGVYNYYREAYPEAYPVYKPLALLFPKGSKTKGLEDLLIASKNSIFLKAEAFSFLS